MTCVTKVYLHVHEFNYPADMFHKAFKSKANEDRASGYECMPMDCTRRATQALQFNSRAFCSAAKGTSLQYKGSVICLPTSVFSVDSCHICYGLDGNFWTVLKYPDYQLRCPFQFQRFELTPGI